MSINVESLFKLPWGLEESPSIEALFTPSNVEAGLNTKEARALYEEMRAAWED